MIGASGSSDAGLRLLAWVSPQFPVGAFAYSHGLETAVDDGHIHDAGSLIGWLQDLCTSGSLANDLIIVNAAWTAAQDDDRDGLEAANELALALCPGRERRLETAATGTAFASAIRASWPDAGCTALPQGDLAYPVAFGATAAVSGLAGPATLDAYGFAFVQNLVSAAVRLGPVGQTDGQRTLAALLPIVRQAALRACDTTLDDIGGATVRSDLASLRHETLYSRLFRS